MVSSNSQHLAQIDDVVPAIKSAKKTGFICQDGAWCRTHEIKI